MMWTPEQRYAVKRCTSLANVLDSEGSCGDADAIRTVLSMLPQDGPGSVSDERACMAFARTMLNPVIIASDLACNSDLCADANCKVYRQWLAMTAPNAAGAKEKT